MEKSVETLLNQVINLPEEERVEFIESVLISFHYSPKRIEDFWAEEAKKRREEIRLDENEVISLDEALTLLR